MFPCFSVPLELRDPPRQVAVPFRSTSVLVGRSALAIAILWGDSLQQEMGRHPRGTRGWVFATSQVAQQVAVIASLRLHLRDLEWAML